MAKLIMTFREDVLPKIKLIVKSMLYTSVGLTLAVLMAMPGLFFFGYSQVQEFQYFLLPLVTVIIVKEILEFAFKDLIITEPSKNELQKRLYTSAMAAYIVPLVISLANGERIGPSFILTLPGWLSLIVFAPLSVYLVIHVAMSIIKITPPLTAVITKQIHDDFKKLRM